MQNAENRLLRLPGGNVADAYMKIGDVGRLVINDVAQDANGAVIDLTVFEITLRLEHADQGDFLSIAVANSNPTGGALQYTSAGEITKAGEWLYEFALLRVDGFGWTAPSTGRGVLLVEAVLPV